MNITFGKADYDLTSAYYKIGEFLEEMKRFARKHALSLRGEYSQGDEKDWWWTLATE